MHDDLQNLRTEYGDSALAASALGSDPMAVFIAWFEEARERAEIPEANAMTLATAGPDGAPSARMVLLKDVVPSDAGFTWFTNLESRKAAEVRATGRAALCWWWPGTPGRQVRAAGPVVPVDAAVNDEYFASRPEVARIGAIASRQSRAVASRAELDLRAAAVGEEAALHRPAHWGGLQLRADELEFWNGRTGRMHDRIAFVRLGQGGELAAHGLVAAAGGEAAVREAGVEVEDPHGTRWLRVRLEP